MIPQKRSPLIAKESQTPFDRLREAAEWNNENREKPVLASDLTWAVEEIQRLRNIIDQNPPVPKAETVEDETLTTRTHAPIPAKYD